jgi:cell division protein FtsL
MPARSTALNHELNIDEEIYGNKKTGRTRPAAGRRSRARSESRVLLLTSLLVVFLTASMLAVQVGICADISRIEKERSAFLNRIEVEKQDVQLLKLKFARLSNPERIRLIAEKDLQMREATEVVFISIRKLEGDGKGKIVLKTTSSVLVAEQKPEMR